MKKIMYADDLAIIVRNEEELRWKLQTWARVFEQHGLKINMEKTEVMWIGKEYIKISVLVNGVQLKQASGFIYLGGIVTENGINEAEVRRRIQAGDGDYRKETGVMGDRRFNRKIRRRELEVCVLPAVKCGLETIAITKEQQ